VSTSPRSGNYGADRYCGGFEIRIIISFLHQKIPPYQYHPVLPQAAPRPIRPTGGRIAALRKKLRFQWAAPLLQAFNEAMPSQNRAQPSSLPSNGTNARSGRVYLANYCFE
jgi:hypothetical protein